MYLPAMPAATSNANGIIGSLRLRLLALTTAILGLVLAPLGRAG